MYLYVYIYMYISMRIHIYIHVCICIYIYTHHTSVTVEFQNWFSPFLLCANHICVLLCAYLYMCV